MSIGHSEGSRNIIMRREIRSSMVDEILEGTGTRNATRETSYSTTIDHLLLEFGIPIMSCS